MIDKNGYQAGNQSMLRQINLSAIMNNMRVEAPISRSTLAKNTGLNKATVTSLIDELGKHNFIKEVGLESNQLGRPSMKLVLNPNAGFIISAEIGVDFVNIIGTDFSPKIIYQSIENIDSEMTVNRVMEILLSNIKKARVSCVSQIGERFFGLALGVPGLIERNTGNLLFAPNLKWNNIPLREYMTTEIDVPVFIDNEANLATLGEYYFGAASQHSDVMYLSAGIGLGGGILRDGQLFRGVTGTAGELGHITMDPGGELCGCGNRGCWETQVSQHALFQYVSEGVDQNSGSVLWEQTRQDLKGLDVATIVSAAQNGDKVARESLEKLGQYLGIGIASMVNVLNPSIVVFGGIMSHAWEFLEPVILAELKKRALFWSRDGIQLVLAQYGNNACVMGGIATVYQSVIDQPNVG